MSWKAINPVAPGLSASARASLWNPRRAIGCVTVIQRFGGALNLNIHFHTLLFDGVFNAPGGGDARVLSAATPDGCRGRRGAREDLSGVDGDAAFGSGRPIGTAI